MAGFSSRADITSLLLCALYCSMFSVSIIDQIYGHCISVVVCLTVDWAITTEMSDDVAVVLGALQALSSRWSATFLRSSLLFFFV